MFCAVMADGDGQFTHTPTSTQLGCKLLSHIVSWQSQPAAQFTVPQLLVPPGDWVGCCCAGIETEVTNMNSKMEAPIKSRREKRMTSSSGPSRLLRKPWWRWNNGNMSSDPELV